MDSRRVADASIAGSLSGSCLLWGSNVTASLPTPLHPTSPIPIVTRTTADHRRRDELAKNTVYPTDRSKRLGEPSRQCARLPCHRIFATDRQREGCGFVTRTHERER